MSVDIIKDVAGNIYEVRGVPVDYNMGYPEDETQFYNSFFMGEQFSDPLIEKFMK